jgi:hypothetical protein
MVDHLRRLEDEDQLLKLTDEEVKVRAGNLFKLYYPQDKCQMVLAYLEMFLRDPFAEGNVQSLQNVRFAGISLESICRVHFQLLTFVNAGTIKSAETNLKGQIQARIDETVG